MTKPDDKASEKFDLTEGTAKFGEQVIWFCQKVGGGDVTSPLIRQIVRSATSVGATYVEADEAGSRKEFRYRISVCKRECRETKHWLRMIAAAHREAREDARRLWQESHELSLIIAAIFRKTPPAE